MSSELVADLLTMTSTDTEVVGNAKVNEITVLPKGEIETKSAISSVPPSAQKKSIMEMFRQMSIQYDETHDKYERIVKLSRDITINSKRIIFLLHKQTTETGIIERAEIQFIHLRDGLIRKLAEELENEDIFNFLRAFTSGLQEYTEAVALHHFLKTGTLLSHEELEKKLVFEVRINEPKVDNDNGGRDGGGSGRYYKRGNSNNYNNNRTCRSNPVPEQKEDQTDLDIVDPAVGAVSTSGDTILSTTAIIEGNMEKLDDGEVKESRLAPPPSPEKKIVKLLFPQTDFVLGLCDVTGELMRGCVSAVGSGDMNFAFRTCHIVQHIYKEMLALQNCGREMQNKMDVLKTSVLKMELSCYQIRIRGKGQPGLSHKLRPLGDCEDSDSGFD